MGRYAKILRRDLYGKGDMVLMSIDRILKAIIGFSNKINPAPETIKTPSAEI